MIAGKLNIISTPIGNLGDITFRAVETLKLSDYILTEDTRYSSKLLHHYQINKKLIPYHAHNEHHKTEKIISDIKKHRKSVSLITDAGTPGISDPGYLLINKAINEDLHVECLPGVTAFIPALLLSGFSLHRFTFIGFLPTKKGRTQALESLAQENGTFVLYESPHRIIKLLNELIKFLDAHTQICVAKELTKINETIYRGSIKDVLSTLNGITIKGEYVIIIHIKN